MQTSADLKNSPVSLDAVIMSAAIKGDQSLKVRMVGKLNEMLGTDREMHRCIQKNRINLRAIQTSIVAVGMATVMSAALPFPHDTVTPQHITGLLAISLCFLLFCYQQFRFGDRVVTFENVSSRRQALIDKLAFETFDEAAFRDVISEDHDLYRLAPCHAAVRLNHN